MDENGLDVTRQELDDGNDGQDDVVYTKAELKALLDGAGIEYNKNANHATLLSLVKDNNLEPKHTDESELDETDDLDETANQTGTDKTGTDELDDLEDEEEDENGDDDGNDGQDDANAGQ